jgi:PKD repeat protein
MKKINTLLLSCFALIQFSIFAQAPVANFSYSNVCVDAGTAFTDLSTNSPNSFYWTFGDGNTSTIQNPTHTYTTPGNYTVTLVAINANGSDTIPQVVTIYANPTLIVGADQTICMGSATTLSASGGIAYNWTPATGLSSSTSSNPSASPSSTTTYTVTVTDVNGCMANDMVNVTVNPLPVVNAGADQTICQGGSFIPVGSGNAITYNWNNGAVDGSPIFPSATTTYTVTGTDAFGCTNTDDVTVIVPSAISLIDNVTNVSCNGGTDGSISITAFGGSAPYVYNWTPIGNTTAVVTGLAAGTYTVTVTDANGCTQQLNSSVTQPNALSIFFSNTVNPSCYGATDGAINIMINGGVPGYSYLWSNASTDFSLTGIGSGTYSVTVTDASGCIAIDSVNLTQPSAAGVIKGIVNFQSAHVTAGDVELIRKNGNTPADIQTQSSLSMDTSGTFIFSNLYPGTYLLKALGDTLIYDNVATYATNTNQWQLATEYNTTGCPGDTVNGVTIDLIELPNNSGTGTINGRLVEGGGVFNKAPGEPIPDIDITVDQSPGGAVMAAATTDINGYFTINNLPMGTYTVYADMHGYGVTLQTIDINATTLSYDVVLCSDTALDMIDMCELTVISVNELTSLNTIQIYPNPAKNTLNIVYNGSDVLNLEVTDITGKKVISQTLKTKTIDVSGLTNGLYFVRLYNQHDDFVQKLVIE